MFRTSNFIVFSALYHFIGRICMPLCFWHTLQKYFYLDLKLKNMPRIVFIDYCETFYNIAPYKSRARNIAFYHSHPYRYANTLLIEARRKFVNFLSLKAFNYCVKQYQVEFSWELHERSRFWLFDFQVTKKNVFQLVILHHSTTTYF